MKVHSIKRNFLVKLCISFAFILSVIATALCITPATANLASANTAPVVMMSEGAQIRKIAPTGIRFSAYVSDTYFTDGVLNDGVEVGMDVSIVVGGETKTQTVSTESVKEEENNVWKWVESDKEGYQKFQVAVWYSETATVEQYATDLTANAFVKVGDNAKYANNAQTRSVAQVANAALTDDMLTETVDEYKDVLESFVSATNAIVWETPSLALSGDELSWTGVTGAKGYFVANEKETIHVLATAENENYNVDLTEFAKDGVVSVTAYGDGTTATYTTATDTKNYHYLTGDQIATFNHAIYAEDLQAGNPNVKCIHGKTDCGIYISEGVNVSIPQFNAENGTVSIATKRDAYSGDGWSNCRINVYSLTLAKGLELDRSGITIKFKIVSTSFSEPDYYLTLANPTSQSDGSYNTLPMDRNLSDTISTPWVYTGFKEDKELNVSSAQLAALGYTDGATMLTFAVWNKKGQQDNMNYSATLELNDISYCDMLAEVTDLVVTNNTLAWTAVDGAENYTVYANGNAIAENVTVTSFDLSSLTETANVQVRANASGKVSSALSVSVYYEVLTEDQLATFDHAGYASNTTYGHPTIKDVVNQTAFHGQPAVFNEANGTVSCTGWRTSYAGSGARIWTWTVNVENAIDLTRDGITIKFSFADYKDYDKGENYFTVINPSELDDSRKTLPIERGNLADGVACSYVQITSKGASYELSVSSAQLSALGYTSETKMISFALWNTVACEVSNYNGVLATLVLDDISYCEMLDTPVVTIDGATASWSAVEGAANYTVSVNGVETTTTELSFDLSSLTENANISVRANSATEGVVSSPFSATVLYDLSPALRIITFDSEEDLDNIVAGNPNISTESLRPQSKILLSEMYAANDGVAHLKLRGETNSWRSTGMGHTVTINLPKALDLTNNNGIEIKFCVSGCSNAAANTELRFMVLHATTIDDGYKAGDQESYVQVVVDSSITNFQTLTLTKEQLGTLGYQDGATYLTLSVWTNGDTLPGQGGSLLLYLDDISYYVE